MARATKKKAPAVELAWFEKYRARPLDSGSVRNARDSIYTTTLAAADEAVAAFEADGRPAVAEQVHGGGYGIPRERQNQ